MSRMCGVDPSLIDEVLEEAERQKDSKEEKGEVSKKEKSKKAKTEIEERKKNDL